MRTLQRLLYWLITGALVGTGLNSFSLFGLIGALAGTGMLFFGIIQVGPKGFWMALVGFGALPAFFFIYRYLTVNRCLPEEPLVVPFGVPVGTVVSCGWIPGSTLSYGLAYGVVALAGLAWGLIGLIRRATHLHQIH